MWNVRNSGEILGVLNDEWIDLKGKKERKMITFHHNFSRFYRRCLFLRIHTLGMLGCGGKEEEWVKIRRNGQRNGLWLGSISVSVKESTK